MWHVRRAAVTRASAVIWFASICVSIAACGGSAPPAPPFDAAAHVKEVEAWRVKHEADYRREWVTIAGLYPLTPGGNTVGSDPSSDVPLPAPAPPLVGLFMVDDKTVTFTAVSESPVRLGDQPVTRTIVMHGGPDPPPGPLKVGDLEFFVHLSGNRRTIRVRDPDSQLVRDFRGFSWFPIDASYRVVGRFIKDAASNKVTVPNTLGDEDAYTTDGVVEFELSGQTLRLRPFTTRPKRFYFVFRDVSSGQETYETARFLYADLKDDGTAVLDFNIAYNPPCAFNPYTTCPIPLRENRLGVKVLAGERAYAK
jgi:hypothetical protein